MKQNDFGAFEKKPVKHDMSRPEHILTPRYLRKTIDALLRTFDEVEYTTEPDASMIGAKCRDGRRISITILFSNQ